MSEKFNLKGYQKINGDEHIEKRLRDEHQDEPNAIEEKQLEGYRAETPETIIEKQLEKIRSVNSNAITEWSLENSTSKLVQYRNKEAFTGDINKLEEQRLLGANKQEDEKTESASETPKQMRWWEESSPDGLKIAKKELSKTAALGFEESDRWNRMKTDESYYDDEYDFSGEEMTLEGLDQLDPDISDVKPESGPVTLVEPPRFFESPMPAMFLKFDFSNDLIGQASIIEKAVEAAVNDMFPELLGLVGSDAISIDDNFANVRIAGFQYAETFKHIQLRTKGGSDSDFLDSSAFEEVEYEEVSMAPEGAVDSSTSPSIATGAVKINSLTGELDTLIDDVIEFINDSHPNLDIDISNVDTSELKTRRVITFQKQVEVPEVKNEFEVVDDKFADDFEITEMAAGQNATRTSQVNVKKK